MKYINTNVRVQHNWCVIDFKDRINYTLLTPGSVTGTSCTIRLARETSYTPLIRAKRWSTSCSQSKTSIICQSQSKCWHTCYFQVTCHLPLFHTLANLTSDFLIAACIIVRSHASFNLRESTLCNSDLNFMLKPHVIACYKDENCRNSSM